MDIFSMRTDDIVPYEKNAKRHDDRQVTQIANSLKRFGWQQPIVVDKDNVVVIGHGRLMAAKRLGMSEVPVTRADKLTPKEVKALRLADNKLNESPWDEDLLRIDLDDIGLDIDMGDFGFDTLLDDGDAEPEAGEDKYEEPDNIEHRAMPGSLWELGQHRLMCGDSSDGSVIERLMGGAKAKLLLTDPPYGIKADKGFSGAVGFSGKGKPIERRHYKDEWDSVRPGKEVFEHICLMAKNAIIFGGNFFADELPVGNHWIVWNKHNTMPTYSDAELAWTNIKRNSVKLYDCEWNGLIGKEKERFHPTQKPVRLFVDILKDYTDDGDVVCDFFGGSGSTLIACERINRRCYMCELDPHYVDVIIDRWEKLTGEKAKQIE